MLVDNFNTGTPGQPLVGPYFVSEVIYTTDGRDGTIGLADGGAPDGSAAYYNYEPGPEMATATATADYLVTAGTGLPTSGTVQGAQLLSFYGTSPVDGPFSDMFALSLVIKPEGIGLAFDNIVGGSYNNYVIEGSGGGSTTTDYASHTEQPTGVWRTVRGSVANGDMLVDVLDTAGALVWSSGPIDVTGWTLTGCYVGLGHEATYGHSVTGDNFTFDAPAPQTSLLLRGVEGDMPFADIHQGAYAVPEGPNPYISFQTRLGCAVPCWVHVMIQWYDWDGAVLHEMPLDRGVIAPFGGTPVTLVPVDFRVAARRGATHWRPKYVFSSTDPLDVVTPIPDGTEVAIEAIYIPDNGRSLAGREFLDGDQSYGVWEGEDHRSSSVYGIKLLPVPFTFVGNTEVGGNGATVYNLVSLPAATQVGDLVVLAMMGGSTGAGVLATCDDPRMTPIYTGGMSNRYGGVWVGYATTLDPIVVQINGNSGSPIGQFWALDLSVIRSTEVGHPIEFDPDKVAITATYPGGAGNLPGLTGYFSGAIGVTLNSGGIGGSYGSVNWSGGAPGYTDATQAGTYAVPSIAYSHSLSVAQKGAVQTDPADTWMGIVIGLKRRLASTD